MRIPNLGALTLAALATSTCARVCTLMYVPDEVILSLGPASAWPPGHYRFEAANRTCDVTLPLAAAEPRSTACVALSADGGVPAVPSTLEATASGDALTELRLMDLEPPAPANLEVRVLRDGEEVSHRVLTPQYVATEPNGIGCGVTQTGRATLDVSAVNQGLCTLIYAPDGVSVSFDPTIDWEPGRYRFEAANLTCERTLPLGLAGTPTDGCFRSADGARTSSDTRTDASGARITALSLIDLVPPTPATLELRVLRDEQELTRQTLTPEFTATEPNGPGCGVTHTGRATLRF